jgi:hypothetical protein
MISKLAINAAKASTSGGRGWIEIEANNGSIRATVYTLPRGYPRAKLDITENNVRVLVSGISVPHGLWALTITAYSLSEGKPVRCTIAIPLWTIRISLTRVVYVDTMLCSNSTCTMSIGLRKLVGGCKQPILIAVEYGGCILTTAYPTLVPPGVNEGVLIKRLHNIESCGADSPQ